MLNAAYPLDGLGNRLFRKISGMPQMTKESANQIVIDFVKKEKNAERVDVAVIEDHSEGWMVRGTVPIDMEGHPWVQKFAVVVDWKGKVRSTDFALL